MKKNAFFGLYTLVLLLLITSCKKEQNTSELQDPSAADAKANNEAVGMNKNAAAATVTVFSTGLNNPRGLTFGPDGQLYVAEGGIGVASSGEDRISNALTTVTSCMQVPFPVGPYRGSPTGGRISKINSRGARSTVSDQFPTSTNNLGETIGVGDVKFIGKTMYALITGGGCSHGNPNSPNGVVKVNPNGSLTMVANLSNWSLNHPVKNPEEDDYEPDGDWYSMVDVGNTLYAVEANHGEIVKINNGNVSRLVDISASQGHIVPTSIASDGELYFGNLNPFPIIDGSSKIYKVNHKGDLSVAASGLTTVLGLVIDKKHEMYVLENTTGHPYPTPGTGKIIKIDKKGNQEVIASNLTLPTGMTMGPDGNLYVSNVGFGPQSVGGGQILKVDISKKSHN